MGVWLDEPEIGDSNNDLLLTSDVEEIQRHHMPSKVGGWFSERRRGRRHEIQAKPQSLEVVSAPF